MHNLDIINISTLVTIIGCFVALAGWLSGRDKKIISDAQWRGSVDAKLDLIVGIKSDMATTKSLLSNHSERILVAESKISRMQKNIDEIKKLRSEV